MERNKINIPEDLQQVCRDFAKVAIKHNLIAFSGKFSHRTNWGGEISFGWDSGRHEANQNEVRISTQLFVSTSVKLQ